ncbi:PAS domain-containing sensor histidine kinase [Paenibacillus sp. SI8]|uniref:sensor histidine kinase n=1 Tax=unclassified Paenibacillus TaxID=185978 RepID=UPI003466BB15
MTILLILLMIAAITLFIAKARNPSAYWMGFVLVGWFLSMSGLILFIAKYGGFYYRVNIVLFFNDAIRNLLLNAPIKIEGISRMITAGRSLFIFSLIGLSVSFMSYKPTKRIWNIHALSFLPALANLIFYDPVIYKWMLTVMDRQHTYVIGWVTRGWLVLAALAAIYILIWKYKRVTIPWVKRQSQFTMMGVFSLVLFYFYLGFMGPLQVFDVRTFYVLYSDFSNFNPPLTLVEWYASIGFTGILSLISILAIWRYTEIEMKMGKEDLMLDRKLNTANMGAQVFTHAVKNQLIMIQLLIKQAHHQAQLIHAMDGQAIEMPLTKADDIVNQTLGRLDQLYKSFKTSHLQLKPHSVQKLISHTLERMPSVPAHITIGAEWPQEETMILADHDHMSEVLYNLLINAVEAIEDDRAGFIDLKVYVEDNWVIIKITDTGQGIPEHLQEQIFDPFYTNKNTTKNWGVGLSYVKHIVLGHYGRIHLESKPGKGSTFQLIIPLYVLKTETKKG